MRFLSAILALSVFWTQTYASAQAGPSQIRIVVLQGEGAVNNIGTRTAQPPRIRVEDTNGKPIEGAMVSFVLPTQGPTGEFTGGRSATIRTDAEGNAGVRSLKPNAVSGKLEIRVNAAYQGMTAQTVISQYNIVVPGTTRKSHKTAVILAVLGAAAAGGVVAATRGSSTSAAPAGPAASPPITITPGSSTAGAPF